MGVHSINSIEENAIRILLQRISLVLLLDIRLFLHMILSAKIGRGGHILDDLLSLGVQLLVFLILSLLHHTALESIYPINAFLLDSSRIR